MNKKSIIKKTQEFVKKTMVGDSGHDFFHIDRVRRTAIYIAKKEKADLFVVELCALLHDVGDYKFHDGREDMGGIISRKFLTKLDLPSAQIDLICDIVDHISFKGSGNKYQMKSLGGQIVQDADRLDAMGAIGIARVFSFAGFKGKAIHDPNIKPNLNKSIAKYKKSDNTAINHFYEKLLLLKNRMNTQTGRKLAIERHKFMEAYLKQFYREWKGE